VPCAVVSPWARRNYVSHRIFDHASICKLVETTSDL
jgi:phospholipase C